jgi:hypothetical protein
MNRPPVRAVNRTAGRSRRGAGNRQASALRSKWLAGVGVVVDKDFGLLVDFCRGELDSATAAHVRTRLEQEPDFFVAWQRLHRTYAVVCSFPAVAASGAEALRGRALSTQLPLLSPSAAWRGELRTSFHTRAVARSLPGIQPRPDWVAGPGAKVVA